MDRNELETQIREATGAHGAWKLKLSTAVRTGALPKPAKDIACDNQCSFGKWLHGLKDDPTVSGTSEFRNVMAAHAEFHRQAGDVAAKVEAGDVAGADATLHGPVYKAATDDLIKFMGEWRHRI